MLRQHFRQVWDQLRGKRPQMTDFLEEVRIREFRGIKDLTVRFAYPVSVLAGPNACGKTTVLFALACAYKVPGSGLKDFTPSTLFPDFRTRQANLPSDVRSQASLEYYYIHASQRYRMRWARSKKNWNRSFLGLKQGAQPERLLYLRTLENLANPSVIRSVLQMGRKEMETRELTADLLTFAHRIMPLRYSRLSLFSRYERSLLFAQREDSPGVSYSEFHMSAGERAILRLSTDVSTREGALVLIDEVEAGMHPFTQQQLMLELQRLALRRNLQVVVTTHSSVILETVPQEARLFLDRVGDNVVVCPPYRDVIQRAFYGQSVDKLSILCEDEMAEAFLRGVLDVLNPRLNLSPADIEVGRDAGKNEFPQHVRALAKFNQLGDFLFVLDGDATPDEEAKVRQAASNYGLPIRLLTLPRSEAPDSWVWKQLRKDPAAYGGEFGIAVDRFADWLEQIEQSYGGAADTPRNIAKGRLNTLAVQLAREPADIARAVGRREAEGRSASVSEFLGDLESAIDAWRKQVSGA